jgi:hypothetical protein
LIEFIRNKIITLSNLKWIIHFGWLKAHAGIEGTELVDKFAKEVAVEDGPIVHDRIPRDTITTREKENGLRAWQKQWSNVRKGALTKAFFPSVRNRLQQKIAIFPEFTTMVTGHGKLRTYLHRLGLTDNPMCPCKEEEEGQQQTTDHLIFQCKKLCTQGNEMIKQIKNTDGNWPTTKETLVNNYLQIFVKSVKAIDFSDLQ